MLSKLKVTEQIQRLKNANAKCLTCIHQNTFAALQHPKFCCFSSFTVFELALEHEFTRESSTDDGKKTNFWIRDHQK